MTVSDLARRSVRLCLAGFAVGGVLLAPVELSVPAALASSVERAAFRERDLRSSPPTDTLLIRRFARLSADSALLVLAHVIADGQLERHERVWPGYDPLIYPAFLVREEVTLVISPDPLGPGLQAVTGPLTPPALAERLYLFYGNIDDYHGRVPSVWRLRDFDLFTALWLFYHEQFHAYQSRSFTGFSDRIRTYFRSRYEPMPADWYARAEIEHRILREALEIPSSDMLNVLVHRYLSVRQTRLSSTPEIAASERFSEWH